MQAIILLDIVSIGLIFGGLEKAGVILLSASVIYGVFYMISAKKREPAEVSKYIFTYNAIMNENLSRIVEHNIISGDFYVSTKIASDKKGGVGDYSGNDILFDNLTALKKKGKLMYVNSGGSITEILSYAYKNECSVVSSNENISKKILQIFSVRVVDIGFLEKSSDRSKKSGDEITVYVTKRTEEGYKGIEAERENVVMSDSGLEENSFTRASVEKVLEISGEKTLYAKKKI
ncbi:MAG: hypothetical protein PHW02_01480 [bacterium]|nr:hypothetical protein [bacterium]